jgi:methylthioribose-1-phosphate isomerase
MNSSATISWDDETGSVCLIDQTRLPQECRLIRCKTVSRLAEAIKKLEVRGAPALGIAGGFGVALAARNSEEKDLSRFLDSVRSEAGLIRVTRPTAVNLSWGVSRVLAAIEDSSNVESAKRAAIAEAKAIGEEDAERCRQIGQIGAELLPDSCTVLTHCNAGALACREWGTALGVVRSAVGCGKKVRVIACETRPLFQGARLTAWELQRDGIEVTVVTDSSAAFLMQQGAVDLVIVGADRITRDAVFNKIGTYMHAVCARHHGIPFYVAAPRSSFDATHSAGEVIIEERDRDEIACCGNTVTMPEGVPALNYAFDLTPISLVSAIICETGVLWPPIDI